VGCEVAGAIPATPQKRLDGTTLTKALECSSGTVVKY